MILDYHILEFNNDYILCSKGFIISLAKGFHILRINLDKKGYIRHTIRDKNTGKRKSYRVHRLIAEAFIPNPDNLPQVNHIDGDKTNNDISNLEWCTNKDNQNHAWQIGLQKPRYKPCIIDGVEYESREQASEKLGVCKTTLFNWMKEGKLVSKK